MKVKIKRIDKELPLPKYQTSGAVAFDLYSRVDTQVEPGETRAVPANVIVCVPEGYLFMVAARSSLAKKKGLMLSNSIGVIDQDYCGPDDEVHVLLYNIKNKPCEIKRGERLAQGIFVKIDKGEWEEVEEVESPTRGGMGSTEGYN
jgi:dUTP pyrophosphatase